MRMVPGQQMQGRRLVMRQDTDSFQRYGGQEKQAKGVGDKWKVGR